MADGSKSTRMTVVDAEGSREYSSGEESEQNKLGREQSRRSPIGKDSDTLSGVEDDENDGNAVDSHDREEVAQGDASQAKSRLLCLKHSRGAEDVTSLAACTSRNAAISCRHVMYATCDAITEGKVRVDKALKKAEKTGELDRLKRYRALASKYDAALKLAAEGTRLIEAVAECAENTAMAVVQIAQQTNKVSTTAQISERPNESIAERLVAANGVAIADLVAIVAYKAEYIFMESMKTCWEDLDVGNVETRDYPTGNSSKARRSGKKIAAWFGIAFFIFCICLLVVAIPYMKHPELRYYIVTVAGILISIPLCFLTCEIFMCCRNVEVKQVKSNNVITRIDDRLRELRKYFVNRNTNPFRSGKKLLAR